ncbi:MAG: hypothetical protein NT001_02545, partial [Candidatus Woesearchaeota archaeon]|nr:hypothetical protein [Candidatus Woesearchaeota archaeon]
YAKFWVHKTIWDSLYHNADIKLSRNISLERARFLEAKSEIEKQGRTANEHNIAEAAGISLKTAKKLFMGGRSLSLDQEMSTDPDMKDFKLGDTRGREDDTIGNIFAKQRRSKIEEALQVLDTRERTILKEIFGFDGCYSMTGPKATSELLDISTQAVNYTKLQALKKIASSQHAPMLRELLMDS